MLDHLLSIERAHDNAAFNASGFCLFNAGGADSAFCNSPGIRFRRIPTRCYTFGTSDCGASSLLHLRYRHQAGYEALAFFAPVGDPPAAVKAMRPPRWRGKIAMRAGNLLDWLVRSRNSFALRLAGLKRMGVQN